MNNTLARNRKGVVVVLALWASGFVIGMASSCTPKTIDLGSRAPDVEDVFTPPLPDVVSEPDVVEAGPSLEDILKARCALPPGFADRYGSAADLTEHIVNRWYLCDDPSRSPLETPSGVQLRIDGTWSLLKLNAAHDALEPSTDPDEGGTFDYYAYSDPDAGTGADGGGGPKIIPINEATPRASIFIYLHRAVSPDFVIEVEFDNPPRRMLMRDVGEAAHSAFYVSTEGL